MRETDNNHVCGTCGEVVFHDQCRCDEPESDAEMGLRRTGSYAEDFARLARAIDLGTMLVKPHMERE